MIISVGRAEQQRHEGKAGQRQQSLLFFPPFCLACVENGGRFEAHGTVISPSAFEPVIGGGAVSLF